VCARQSETGAGMIEGGARPGCRGVTRVTGRRKACLHVVGVGSAVVVLHVAGRTGPAGQVVVAIDVTLRTGQRSVRAREGKPGAVVIEGRIAPCRGVMTGLATGRKLCLPMVGISGAVVVLHVAGRTSRTGQVVVSVGMTLRALQPGVPAGERKAHGVVIEAGRLPRARAMARLAGLRESAGYVIGIGGVAEIL